MLSIQAITPNALELLKTLSARPELNELRLVGGTSLALQYGHRQSVDLEWIDEPVIEDGFFLASDKDIAAMKINAIIGRGSKKDFIDLYVLLQHYSLSDILCFYKLKYPEYSEYRALLSLTYFEDAEMQDMPKMFINDSWDTIKRTIIESVKSYQE